MSIFKKVVGTMSNSGRIRPKTFRKRVKAYDRKARSEFPLSVGSTRNKYAKHMKSLRVKD